MGRLALALVLLALATSADAAARPREDGGRSAASVQQVSQVPELQGEMLTAINELRQRKGLRRLRLNNALSYAALGHSASMAKHGFFSHAGYDGSAFWKRIKPKYRPNPHAYWGIGENLVWASPALSAQQAIDMWLKSPPHRRNLLGAGWREIGLGAVHALAAPGVYQGLDVTVLTADFGVR